MKRIWQCTREITTSLQLNYDPNLPENNILGISQSTSPLAITIHAEILQRILALRDDANYLIRPKNLVIMAIKNIKANERQVRTKAACENLLARLVGNRDE